METKKSKWKTWHKVVLGIVIAFFGLMAIAVNSDKSKINTNNQSATFKTEPAAFDIPNLMDKDSTEINKLLGKPSESFVATRLQHTVDIGDELTYEKGRYVLDIFFDPKTKRSVQFSLTDSSCLIDDFKEVLKGGNIDYENSTFNIKPIRVMSKPDKYTGVTIKL